MQSGWLHIVRKTGLESKIKSTERRVLCEKKLNLFHVNAIAIRYCMAVPNVSDFLMRWEPRNLARMGFGFIFSVVL